MKRSTKKGFTIVELVIVIAIIAILAAVLIPTFASLIQKANESKDTQLVKNLNTALAADNKEHKTMTDALDAAVEFGYDVGKINASATNKEILWDSKNDVFCYYDTNTKTPEYIPETSLKNGAVAENETYKLWKIYTSEAKIKEDTDANKYFSIYWNSADNFTAPLTVGFDAGECTAITTLNYVRTGDKQDVVIRTKGATTLTVDAEKDTIYHYGEAGSVKVIKCDTASYHEFGKVVGNLEIAKGRLELAASANVNTVLVSSAAEGDVKIDVASGATVGTIAPVTDKALADVNASTTIPAEAKQTEVVTPNPDFAGGLGTERSPYLIANAEQFNKLNNLDWAKSYYVKQTEDITITTPVVKFAGVYDGDNNKLIYNYDSSDLGYAYIFKQIASYSEFKNMHVVMGRNAVALLKEADWGTAYGATFENISFSSTSPYSVANTNNFGFVIVEALYTMGEGTPVYTFSNITNNVNLQNEGTCTGVFVGSGPCFNVKTVLNYVNCVNNGEIIGNNVGFLYGNKAYIESVEESASEINVSNCKNTNILMSVFEYGSASFAPALTLNTEATEVGGSFVNKCYFNEHAITVNQEGNKFTINTTDNSVEYKLAFDVSAIYSTKNNQSWDDESIKVIGTDKWYTIFNVSNGSKYFIDLPIDTTKNGLLSGSFKAYDKKTASKEGFANLTFENGYTIVVKDNTTYLIFDTAESCYINCNVSLKVYAYANGVLQGVKTVK